MPPTGAILADVTRAALTNAIESLPADEKLELLGEIWDSLEGDVAVPAWQQTELTRREQGVVPTAFAAWPNVKARILKAK
ncbi:MAG: addiction module protein [Myxococcales bacterium]|nr:addiction module protein [Myxococcales bacterium]